MPGGNYRHFAKPMDLAMLTVFGSGRERTQQEFAALLGQAGFRLQRLVSTVSPMVIVEAVAK